MKLAFTTLGSPNWSFNYTLDQAQKLGFDAIEIRGMEDKMLADEIVSFLLENQAQTKKKVADHHLNICGFGTSVSFHDFEKFPEMLAEGKTSIDVCAQMAIPWVRVFGDRIDSEDVKSEVIRKVIKGIRELCAYASGKDVKVLLEIHGDFNTIENVMEVVNGVKDCPQFGILWDIEHSDKIYGDDFMKFYSQIKPFIVHVHVKDHLRINGGFQLCPVGEGNIPIKDIIKTLEADGYMGYMSLEWEKKWHPELQDAEVVYPQYVKFMKSI